MIAARIFVVLLVLFAAGCGGESAPADSLTDTTATSAAGDDDEAADEELALPGDGDAFTLIANSTEFSEL